MHKHSRWWALGSFLANVLEAPLGLVLIVLVWVFYCNCREMRFGTMKVNFVSNSASLLGATDCNLGGWDAHFETCKLGNNKVQELSDDVFSIWDPSSNPSWSH